MTCMFKKIRYYLLISFKTLEVNALKYVNLILCFLSAPGLAWQACFKKETGITLELLTDIDMLLMIEKELEEEYVMQCIDM